MEVEVDEVDMSSKIVEPGGFEGREILMSFSKCWFLLAFFWQLFVGRCIVLLTVSTKMFQNRIRKQELRCLCCCTSRN